MDKPDLDTLCEKCGNLRIGMDFEIVNGIENYTMICHICDVDKFDTIFIYENIESKVPYMPSCDSWKVYKLEGKMKQLPLCELPNLSD